jgi:predicted RNA methylase
MVQSLIERVQRSVAVHGLIGTSKICARKILSFSPLRRGTSAAAFQKELEFDRKWGVETSGDVLSRRSEVVGSNWLYGIRYEAVDPNFLHQVLSELQITHQEFTFVDFGSGKGRAILIASSFPFKNIVGVEYSPQLDKIAQKNLARFPHSKMRCTNIELVCSDAVTYPIPESSLVIFLNNPFGRKLVEQLVAKVSSSFHGCPRPMVVIYFLGLGASPDLWAKAEFLREVQASERLAVYETR